MCFMDLAKIIIEVCVSVCVCVCVSLGWLAASHIVFALQTERELRWLRAHTNTQSLVSIYLEVKPHGSTMSNSVENHEKGRFSLFPSPQLPLFFSTFVLTFR